MNLYPYIAILWRRKWVVAVTTTVTVAIVVVGIFVMTPVYKASAVVRVATALGSQVTYTDYMYAEQLMNTYAKIATTGPVLEQLVEKLDIDKPPEIDVEIMPGTELVKITCEDPDPVLARDAANTLAEILVAQSRELYGGTGKTAQQILGEQLLQIEQELEQARREYESVVAQTPQDPERSAAVSRSIALKEGTYATLLEQYEQMRFREAVRANILSVVEPAVISWTPVRPRKTLSICLGVAVGLVGGIGLAFLLENLDTRLYTTEQVEQATDWLILGKIPAAKRGRQPMVYGDGSPQAHSVHRLCARVGMLNQESSVRTLLVTSALPQEGKSTLVANLALACAGGKCKVVAVDADLRRPALDTAFGVSNETGLTSVLNGDAILDQAVQQVDGSGVYVLTSGPLPPDPVELFSSSQMATLIERLTEEFDLVLLDTPSVLAAADVTVLAPLVDGVVLVVELGQAQEQSVRDACRQLADVKAKPIGVVVNRAEKDRGCEYYSRSSAAPKGKS